MRGQPFASALAAWVAVGLIYWIGMIPWLLSLNDTLTIGVGVALFTATPIALTGWAVSRALRKRASWWAVLIVPALAACLLLAGVPLWSTASYVRFWVERPAYDAVVADVLGGRISASPGDEHQAHGVRYWVAPGEVLFPWRDNYHGPLGVVYSENDCPERPPRRPQTARTVPGAPVMKFAGRADHRKQLHGRYCLTWPLY